MLCFVFVLLGTWLAGFLSTCERHSLTYTYTAFSKPVDLPGFHEFMTMGRMDNKVIDYYDSDEQKLIPKQAWMAKHLEKEYWERESPMLEQQWFKAKIKSLMKRLRQNDTDTHIFQRIRGCEGEVQPDDTIKFVRGMDMYSYDGNNLISFDNDRQVWVATTGVALETSEIWGELEVLKEYTKNYLEKECIEWMSKFRNVMQEHPPKTSPPEVYLYSQKSRADTNIILTCLATGFYKKDTILQIKRDGRVLTKEDGLQSTGVRPNEDDTFQRKDHVEVLKSDVSTFACEVIHPASNVHIIKNWDHTLPKENGATHVVAVVVVVVVVVVVLVAGTVAFICYRKKKNQMGTKGSDSHESSTLSVTGNEADPLSKNGSERPDSIKPPVNQDKCWNCYKTDVDSCSY